jgi:hypothetical protein
MLDFSRNERIICVTRTGVDDSVFARCVHIELAEYHESWEVQSAQYSICYATEGEEVITRSVLIVLKGKDE